MNKQDLLNKLAAKQAAKEVTPVTTELSQLNYFQIIWSEAGSFHDGLMCVTWKDANKAMQELWNNVKKDYQGCYYKTKVTIVWANGMSITDRLDLGTGGDFNPDECTIQDYIKDATSVMYESNLQKGDRQTLLSWSDSEQVTSLEDAATQLSEAITAMEAEPDIPTMLKQLIGIVDTIEEANDNSDAALIKCSEQVERCEFYITYLQSILPILKARTNATKHTKKVSMPVNSFNSHLN